MRSTLLAIILPVLLPVAAPANDYVLEQVAGGLDHPWCVAFLPDGSFLVTERSGQLLHLDGDERTLIGGVPDTYVAGQGGFFDVLPDPEFTTNKTLYLSFADGNKKANRTAVLRARLEGDRLVGGEVILRVQPDKNTAHHYGGRLAFLPDGTLLVTTGEGFRFRDAAQDLDSQFGKTLRIRPDGSVPPDNPYVDRGGPAAKVWTWGHRNPQGLAVDPATGTVWLHEHGPRGGDEVNRIEPSANYGWPAITYGVDYSGAQISPYTEYDGMEQPVKYWDPSIAPSGLTVYRGDAFPAWAGSLFVGALKNRDVRRLGIDANGTVTEEILFTEIGERIRDVRTGPDGYLYILTDSADGSLLRVRPD
jgi:glucose/arabinose dehydrogenase